MGYTEWLFLVILLGCLYGTVVYLDKRAPAVISGNQHGQFSEQRARIFLTKIASLGPRVSGSENCEIKAFNIIRDKLAELQHASQGFGKNRIEIDVDRPTGCFDLKFLSSFTLCYHKITNIVARIGPTSGPTAHSVLLNCHFDTLPDTPGATDDAVSCAIMMEVLENLAYSNESLQNDIIFLFNGGLFVQILFILSLQFFQLRRTFFKHLMDLSLNINGVIKFVLLSIWKELVQVDVKFSSKLVQVIHGC